LKFVKYLAIALALYSLLGVIVLLPIDLTGEEGNIGFARTTVANLSPTSKRLWAPLVLMVVFSFLSFILVFTFREWWWKTR
jgi:hypothetical protein